MEQDFDISERVVDGRAVVSVSGELDMGTSPLLRKCLEAQLEAGRFDIVVDLLAVTFLDSTALGVLVGSDKSCSAAGGGLRLVFGESRVLKVFEITGLNKAFTILPTVDQALEHRAS